MIVSSFALNAKSLYSYLFSSVHQHVTVAGTEICISITFSNIFEAKQYIEFESF